MDRIRREGNLKKNILIFMNKIKRIFLNSRKDGGIREWDIENRENIKLVVEQNKNLGSKLITVRIIYL